MWDYRTIHGYIIIDECKSRCCVMPMKKNLIMGVIENYSWEMVEAFFTSYKKLQSLIVNV